MKKEYVTGHQYDLGGGEIGRTGKITFLNKFLPMGNLGGGPGIRCVMTLMVLHWLGKPLFKLLTPHEDRLASLYRRIKRA